SALGAAYRRQLREIGGRFRIVADSAAVARVLRLTGVLAVLRDDGASPALGTGPAPRCEAVERHGMILQVFPRANGGPPGRLRLIGDPPPPARRRYEAAGEGAWVAGTGAAAPPLGALGPSFDACRGRFGEFLAVAGVAAYRPSAGPGRPDFEHATGAFVPAVRVLYGLAFPMERPSVVRFEARGEPGSAPVPLSRI